MIDYRTIILLSLLSIGICAIIFMIIYNNIYINTYKYK
jgi:hypothetical protein